MWNLFLPEMDSSPQQIGRLGAGLDLVSHKPTTQNKILCVHMFLYKTKADTKSTYQLAI